MKKHLLVLFTACLGLTVSSQNSITYKYSKKIDLPGDGKWDYMSVDDNRNRLYVSHGDRVHVIDLATDKAIAEWTGLDNVRGIAFSETENKVYVANTASNNVVIYNATTLEKMSVIELPGGKKPDCILFDAFSLKAFVFCGGSNNVIILDGKTDQVAATLALGGKPEFACSNDRGLIYNNLEDKNEVVVIDAKSNQVVKHFPLLDGKAPTGITIDKRNDRLFVACEESNKLFVLSASSGKIVARVPIGQKTDGLIYEQELQLIVTSDGAGTATLIKQETPDKYSAIQTIKTHPGLKTICHERKTHRFFISGADLEKDGKTVVHDTFGVYICTPNY